MTTEKQTVRKTLEFRWTVSRGRDTYGYNICSLWIDRRKVASCNGGGYDMQGTVLGEWIQNNFIYQLTKLKSRRGGESSDGFYGLTFHKMTTEGAEYHETHQGDDDHVCLDGGCGIESMKRIAEAIGIDLRYVMDSKNITVYTAEWEE